MKTAVSIIGIILGAIAIIFGLVIMGSSLDNAFYGYTTYLGTATFGADYYTNSYQAMAFTGNATSAIYHIICYGIGAFFIFGGAIDILCFILKLAQKK